MSLSLLPGVEPPLEVVVVHPADERAAPLFAELADEYDARYGDLFGGARHELTRYPVEEFTAPAGALLLLLEDGAAVAGGAIRTHETPGTVEVKRMWTSARHRRRGLARRVLTELEQLAARRGADRVFLTTGPRQPEAEALYLAAGYTPLFDPAVPRPTDLETLRALPVADRVYAFEKALLTPAFEKALPTPAFEKALPTPETARTGDPR